MARTIVSRFLIPAVLASLAAISSGPRTADACSCRQSPSAEAALAGSDVVFEARVASVTPPPGTGIGSTGALVTVKLNVLRAWKGAGAGLDVGRDVTISTPSGSATCGYTFQPNETYVVYAMRADGGVLSTNICMRTKRSADAAEDITALNAAAPSPAQTTTPAAPPASASADSAAPPFEANPGVPAVSAPPPPPPPGPKPIPKAGANAGCSLPAGDIDPSSGAAYVIAAALAAAAIRRPGRPRRS